jgi:hypothetical protein
MGPMMHSPRRGAFALIAGILLLAGAVVLIAQSLG